MATSVNEEATIINPPPPPPVPPIYVPVSNVPVRSSSSLFNPYLMYPEMFMNLWNTLNGKKKGKKNPLNYMDMNYMQPYQQSQVADTSKKILLVSAVIGAMAGGLTGALAGAGAQMLMARRAQAQALNPPNKKGLNGYNGQYYNSYPVYNYTPVQASYPVQTGYPLYNYTPIQADYSAYNYTPIQSNYPIYNTAPITSYDYLVYGYPTQTDCQYYQDPAYYGYQDYSSGTPYNGYYPKKKKIRARMIPSVLNQFGNSAFQLEFLW